MKAILLVFDSLNRRFLPPYGNQWVKAPNFERLQTRSVTFDNAYIGSMPCMPARRDLHTGRLNFLHRSWGPIEPYDDSLPAILGANGVYSHLVTDHYHYFEEGGCTYHTKYNSWESVRGQEWDPWKGHVADPSVPEVVEGLQRQRNRQNWVNRQYLTDPSDHYQCVTFDLGLEFMRTNRDQDNWFLQIESFDPHEPYVVPDDYRALYNDRYNGPLFDWPEYRKVVETPEQIEHVQLSYAALVSMCDAQLGRVLDYMDRERMWDDTMLIVTTDHGFLLGEHGWWGKNRTPVFNEIAHIPLFIWDPRSGESSRRTPCLAQWIDLAPTLLEFFGIPTPKDMLGKSLERAIASDLPVRSHALFGMFGGHVNVTDGRYVYMRSPAQSGNSPLFEYTIMPTHIRHPFSVEELKQACLHPPFSFTKNCPVLKIPGRPQHQSLQHEYPSMLFDISTDYRQQTCIDSPHVEHSLVEQMVRLMKEHDTPPEQLTRLSLPF